MTVCCAVQLEDGNVYVATDSAVGYSDGYRRPVSRGKWWDDFQNNCFILESGSDFALARIKERMAADKTGSLGDPGHVGFLVRRVQEAIKGQEGVEGLDAELIHVSSGALIHVVGGDGGVIGPYEFTAIGHGAPVVNPILEYAVPRMKRRTEAAVSKVVMDAFRICAIYCDSVAAPFFERVY